MCGQGGYPKAGSIPKWWFPIFTFPESCLDAPWWGFVQPHWHLVQYWPAQKGLPGCPQELLTPISPPAVVTSMFPLAESQIPCPQQHVQFRYPPPAHFPWTFLDASAFCRMFSSPQRAHRLPLLSHTLTDDSQQPGINSSTPAGFDGDRLFPKEPAPSRHQSYSNVIFT